MPLGSIEGYPFIIRFKTDEENPNELLIQSIEGYPFIIRFKTIRHIGPYMY